MKRQTWDVIKKAFVDSIPIMAGYVFIGIGFGVIMEDKGMGIWWVLAMCILIYSGAMQFVTISLITGGASLIASAITALMVSCRHLFYAISMIEGYKNAGLEAQLTAEHRVRHHLLYDTDTGSVCLGGRI